MSDVVLEKIRCRACGQPRTLDEYRIYETKPATLYMDFCVHCEKREGTITLYRRYHTHGTPEIGAAVFAAERTPEARRTEAQVRLLVERDTQRAPETNEELIRRELARRELAKRKLIFFTKAFQPDYKPGWVHSDICRRLEKFVADVEKGLSPRLMIAMPPRHGKSLLGSDIFPSWILGKHPEWGIIGASYAQSLPVEFSRNIRDRLKDEEFQAMFPDCRLRADSQGVESWKTTKGGGYIAAGVGVGINGKGMHVGIADDLIKDATEAASEVMREKTYAWYKSVFRLRLAPGGGILMIGTRWHDDDVQGRELTKEELLRKNGVSEAELEQWEVVRYPGLAEGNEYLLSDGEIFVNDQPPDDEPDARRLRLKGEALHPERYSRTDLMKIKHTMPPRDFSALFQQNPTPDDGDFFQAANLIDRRLPPEKWPECRLFVTFDFAISQRTSRRDFTVGGVFALDANDHLYLLRAVRGRWGITQIVKNIVDLIMTYNPEVFAGERGQIYEAVWPLVKQELGKRRKYITFDESLVPIQDKETRAQQIRGRTEARRFFFSWEGPDRPDVYTDIRKECLRFPDSTNDDCVDMLAWAGRLALKLSLPQATHRTPAMKSWRDRLPDAGGSTYMAA